MKGLYRLLSGKDRNPREEGDEQARNCQKINEALANLFVVGVI